MRRAVSVICGKCGAENPDYAFYCGRCAAELKRESDSLAAVSLPKSQPATTIESILSRNLLRIEENAAKKRRGIFGKFRGRFWKSGTLVFKSEFEDVTLFIDDEGHASVRKGKSQAAPVELAGPHESFMAMFQNERDIRCIPSSITVRLGGKELPDDVSRLILRDGIEKLLRTLFE